MDTQRRVTGVEQAAVFHYGSSGTYLPVEEIMASVTFDGITRVYPGTKRPSVDNLSLEIEDGEFDDTDELEDFEDEDEDGLDEEELNDDEKRD